MWYWEESHPASPLYYSWGELLKNCSEKVGRDLVVYHERTTWGYGQL